MMQIIQVLLIFSLIFLQDYFPRGAGSSFEGHKIYYGSRREALRELGLEHDPNYLGLMISNGQVVILDELGREGRAIPIYRDLEQAYRELGSHNYTRDAVDSLLRSRGIAVLHDTEPLVSERAGSSSGSRQQTAERRSGRMYQNRQAAYNRLRHRHSQEQIDRLINEGRIRVRNDSHGRQESPATSSGSYWSAERNRDLMSTFTHMTISGGEQGEMRIRISRGNRGHIPSYQTALDEHMRQIVEARQSRAHERVPHWRHDQRAESSSGPSTSRRNRLRRRPHQEGTESSSPPGDFGYHHDWAFAQSPHFHTDEFGESSSQSGSFQHGHNETHPSPYTTIRDDSDEELMESSSSPGASGYGDDVPPELVNDHEHQVPARLFNRLRSLRLRNATQEQTNAPSSARFPGQRNWRNANSRSRRHD